MCVKTGAEYPSGPKLLWRQAEPKYIVDDGLPSSQVFEPMSEKDEGCLSVDDGDMVTAADSYTRFTAAPPHGFGCVSESVWALSVNEVVDRGLSAWADPIPAAQPLPANPSHAVIEFGDLNRSQRKKVAQKLKVLAIQRGRQHP